MASIFTTTDRDNIKAAMVQFAIDGYASVTIDGNTVAIKSLDELRRLLELVNADLAGDADKFGLRMVQLTPPECG